MRVGAMGPGPVDTGPIDTSPIDVDDRPRKGDIITTEI
jgi:hypothetical protein